ncbi:MAG: PD-(D/E)XK nuclease family protein [Geopsychrobacter sp.]|nr:PD-(D/E)XK nuclease family protein [Geopsychrobacter sp.]
MSLFLEKIISEARQGALILTSNKRLSRHLQATFDKTMLTLGETVWKTPQIFSLEGWLGRMFSELDLDWQLLEGHAQKRLWEQVIEEDSTGGDKELLQLGATAEKARQAAQLLGEYQVDLKSVPLTEDQQAFARWWRHYGQLCRDQGWRDRGSLVEAVLDALKNRRLDAPQRLVLTGFDQVTPLLVRLGQQVEDAGGRVNLIQADSSTQSQAGLFMAKDPQHEILQAACWTRALLMQGAESIGIVVTDLRARRSSIERIFRDQIDPQAILHLSEEETAFSLSLGAPLIEQGPIHAALEILAVSHRLPLDQLSFLLRTPYLKASQTEADARAGFDSRLRSFRQQSFSLTNLVDMIQKGSLVPEFGRLLKVLIAQQKQRKRRMPGEWAAQFDATLVQVGWPGERSLASSEYQMLSAWRDKLLPALASLDAVSKPLEPSQALSLLRRLAAEIEFQIEAPTGPVQVVGLLESAGLEFDHLWVMGMSEEILPSPARPNPFLPLGLQVELQMPHASAERELDFARQVVARLKVASPASVFSYARRAGDCELRPSPLIDDLPPIEPVFAALADLRSQMLAQPPVLDELSDTQGPVLDSKCGRGGTSLLKDQALCPFRAFARHRLQAYGFDEAQPGLDAMTRGNLLHQTLEFFWTEVKDQQTLNGLTDSDRWEQVERAVARSLEQNFKDRPAPQAGLLEIEQTRLQRLVEEWLIQIEQERSSFAVIRLEDERVEQIGALQIRTIIDRIDRLADGSLVILDYKTGAVEAELLVGERLLEPQLPIYAISNCEAEADGVAFAQVRSGNCKLIGVARESGLLPKVAGVAQHRKAQALDLSNWDELLQHWRKQLETVAADFVAGVALVDPVDYKHACQYCDLSGLCRIAEAEICGVEA